MVARRVAVRAVSAVPTKDAVARLAKQQFSAGVAAALRYNLPPLPRHEVQQLVNEEGWRQRRDAATRNRDQLAAYGAAEGARVARLRRGYSREAVQANCVRARQQLRRMLAAVVCACK